MQNIFEKLIFFYRIKIRDKLSIIEPNIRNSNTLRPYRKKVYNAKNI